MHLMTSDEIDFNHTNYVIGIVQCDEYNFKMKAGLTQELCDSSRTLCFKKAPPYLFKCHYKSMAHFKEQILQVLRQNDYKNFGTTVSSVKAMYHFDHRFILNLPKIPITRL